MIRLALLYPVVCFVLLGAHLLFQGFGLAVALLPLVPAVLLFVRRTWCAQLCVALLILAGFEWVRTAVELAMARQAADLPWIRATVIIGACAAVTWLAALMLVTRRLAAFYKREQQ